MADWNKPTIASNYVTFVDEVRARDVDAMTLLANSGSSISTPYQAIKLLRSPAKFQEWTGAAFQDIVLSPAGGGTGVTSIAGLIPQLGLGSMAYQNSTNVAITGGTINNGTLTNCVHYGNCGYNGPGFGFSGTQGATPLYVVGNTGNYAFTIDAPVFGALINGGATKDDSAVYVRNQAGTKTGLRIRGDMGVLCPIGLVIPVGTNAFVPA